MNSTQVHFMNDQFFNILNLPDFSELSTEAKFLWFILCSEDVNAVNKKEVQEKLLDSVQYVNACQELCLLNPYYKFKYHLSYHLLSNDAKLIHLGVIYSAYLFNDLNTEQYDELASKLNLSSAIKEKPKNLVNRLGEDFFRLKDKSLLAEKNNWHMLDQEELLILFGFELQVGDLFFNGYLYEYPDEYYGEFKYHKELLEVFPTYYDDYSPIDLFPAKPPRSLTQKIEEINHLINNSNIYQFEWRHQDSPEKKVTLYGFFDSEYFFKIKITFNYVGFMLLKTVWGRQWEVDSFKMRLLSDNEKRNFLKHHEQDYNQFENCSYLIMIQFLPRNGTLPAKDWQTQVIGCSNIASETGYFDKATGELIEMPTRIVVEISVDSGTSYTLSLQEQTVRMWLNALEKESINLAMLLHSGFTQQVTIDAKSILVLKKTTITLVEQMKATHVECDSIFGVPLEAKVLLPVPVHFEDIIQEMEQMYKTISFNDTSVNQLKIRMIESG